MILDHAPDRGPSPVETDGGRPGSSRDDCLRLDLIRGGPDSRIPESTHRVHVSVTRPDGTVVLRFGRPDRITMIRSAAKPFQVLPLLEVGVLGDAGLGSEAMALCAASHGGEPEHVSGVRDLLGATGGREDELACGPHPPMNSEAARALARSGLEPGRIHNNCSGKHAGMMALARSLGEPVEGYHEGGHPVQERMAQVVARWTGVDRSRLVEGVDGCGVLCFGVPLASLALAYARLMEAAQDGLAPAGQVVGAMTRHPGLVAGRGRLCTDLLRAGRGHLVAKVGAEGVYGAALSGPRGVVGIALKVEDGHRRAAELALLHLLDLLEVEAWTGVQGVLGEVRRTHSLLEPNTRGEPAARWEARTGPQVEGGRG